MRSDLRILGEVVTFGDNMGDGGGIFFLCDLLNGAGVAGVCREEMGVCWLVFVGDLLVETPVVLPEDCGRLAFTCS